MNNHHHSPGGEAARKRKRGHTNQHALSGARKSSIDFFFPANLSFVFHATYKSIGGLQDFFLEKKRLQFGNQIYPFGNYIPETSRKKLNFRGTNMMATRIYITRNVRVSFVHRCFCHGDKNEQARIDGVGDKT